MSDLPVVIPTHERHGGRAYEFFRELNPYVVVRSKDQAPEGCPEDRVIIEREPGITPARNAALHWHDRFLMVDDDLQFSWKDRDRVPAPTAQDVVGAVAAYLMYVPFVGFAQRWMSQGFPPDHIVCKLIRSSYGVNKDRWPAGFEPRFRFPVSEDMDWTFQHIAAGIAPVALTSILVQDKPGSHRGKIDPSVRTGCNTWRTEQTIADATEQLRAAWPDYVGPRGEARVRRAWKLVGGDTAEWERLARAGAELAKLL